MRGAVIGIQCFEFLMIRSTTPSSIPVRAGGHIVAVDLKTGKELWESPLEGIGPIQHSAYRTLLNLTANHDVVSVYGNESMGRYYEIKDAKTGKTVGNRVFPKKETSNQ